MRSSIDFARYLDPRLFHSRWQLATLYSNRTREMWKIDEDLTAENYCGGGYCSEHLNMMRYGDKGKGAPNCQHNLETAIRGYGMDRWNFNVDACFNVFVGPGRGADGPNPGPLAALAAERGKTGHETLAVQMIGGSTPMQHWSQGEGDDTNDRLTPGHRLTRTSSRPARPRAGRATTRPSHTAAATGLPWSSGPSAR